MFHSSKHNISEQLYIDSSTQTMCRIRYRLFQFEQIFLICFFSLFLPTPPSLNLFSSKKYASVSLVCSYIKLSENSLKKYENYRHAHQDMCGTREILKDGNPSELVTRLGTISTNFLNIHRVEQVSVYKLCF